jgi:hypothetical protein
MPMGQERTKEQLYSQAKRLNTEFYPEQFSTAPAESGRCHSVPRQQAHAASPARQSPCAGGGEHGRWRENTRWFARSYKHHPGRIVLAHQR